MERFGDSQIKSGEREKGRQEAASQRGQATEERGLINEWVEHLMAVSPFWNPRP